MVWRVTFDVRWRGQDEGETMVFEQDEIFVGRTPSLADMIFVRDNLSGQHCKFEVRDDGTVWIIDLGSTNGTWVNGAQAREQVFGLVDELFAGDRMVRLAKPAEWVEPEPAAEYELLAHPRSEGVAIERVRVLVSRLGGDLELQYVLEGAIERLEVPHGHLEPDRLWEHTCAELFVGGTEGTAYVEWNFSPTLQSARFAFSDYRERSGHERGEVRVRMKKDANTLALTARGAFVQEPTRIGLSAITRDADGAQSFWALAHPSERPDFHHRDGFVAALGPVQP